MSIRLLYKITGAVFLMIIMTSCGFHLRGMSSNSYRFPFRSAYLDCRDIVVCSNIQNAIQMQSLTKLESEPAKSEVIIKVLNEQTSRKPTSFNSAGRISTFHLVYAVTAQVWQDGQQLGPDIHVSSSADLSYNDSTILASNQDEVTFWNNLHETVTNLLIRRLTLFRYQEYLKNGTTTQ